MEVSSNLLGAWQKARDCTGGRLYRAPSDWSAPKDLGYNRDEASQTIDRRVLDDLPPPTPPNHLHSLSTLQFSFVAAMASVMRPSLLRQSQAAQQRVFSTITRQTTLRPSIAAALPKPTTASRVAAFHATQRKAILPALPQKIKGTLNEPTAVPDPAPAHGSYHWSFERVVSAGLIPLTIAPFAAGSLNPVMDSVLCALLVVHSHIGFEACIIDYFPRRRVPNLYNASMWALRIGTVTLGIALYSFETNDVGITELVSKLWSA
ncbi:unnamed protein product [Periconia digitata]|uniref:Succinate dehydrogenase [ubiquinone] cytochrome b small subunit n=1 Tax=Periconia digitata TaxID=1303443 RepID=A0A9W4UQP6_9PLEO|nr:unnamed protein product [Periconia digitata]